MKKPLTRKKGNQLPLAEMDPKAFEKSPATRSFFLDCRFEGEDEERQPGMVMLSCTDSRWTLMIKERTSCQQLSIAAPTLSDLWKLLEGVLSDDQAQWTDDTWAKERRPRAGKRRT